MFQRIGIAGTGQMGLGIAQIFAQAGFETVVLKVSEGELKPRADALAKQLKKLVDKGKMPEAEMRATLERVRFTQHMRDLHTCDLVLESVIENLEVKTRLFRELDEVVQEQAFFATNTSTLGIEELAQAVVRRDRFYGLHFFNPPQVMKLVEVIPTLKEDPRHTEALCKLMEKLDKVPIVVKDETGFIVNRLLTPYLIDAIRAYERGLATIAAIDQAMKLGTNHPMGPFELSDYIGLDIVLHMSENLWQAFREPRLAPPSLLKRLVKAGELGRKTEIGFYDYRQKPPAPRTLR